MLRSRSPFAWPRGERWTVLKARMPAGDTTSSASGIMGAGVSELVEIAKTASGSGVCVCGLVYL